METRFFNSLNFGMVAIGNGNENAVALQRAVGEVQSRGGGTIEIPPGIYEVSGTIFLNPTKGISLHIRGAEDVALVQTGGSDAMLFETGGVDRSEQHGNVIIENLQLRGDWKPVETEPDEPAS